MSKASNPSKQASLEALRHTTEHILTLAMLRIWGQGKIIMAMGPATEDGFYFDFDTPEGFSVSEKDFPQIEKEMQQIINTDLPVKHEVVTVKQARKLFSNNPYKQEWLDEIEQKNEPASLYWLGDEFVDLCAGPHVNSTSQIKAFKLLSLAGAYWHGDEKNKMLTRIYGTTFPSRDKLKQYLWQLEEAKKRDHRKLGKQMDLFTFSNYVGSGLPLYTPKGALIRRLINEYVEAVQSQQDYFQVWTPQLVKADLFKVSGHYDKYQADMFRVKSNYSDEEFFLKPMNCPQHTQIYASRPRSYRDLPIRLTDFAMLYRDEKPGELSGLARVRSFSQDDCHIFCTESQVDNEIDRALAMTKEIMKTYGFSYRYRLSTRDPIHPEKYIGEPQIWDKVEHWAEVIMKRNQIDYYEAPGEAAFYAPKMDLMATDALGREWQLSTVQIDFFMPQRFNLSYTDSDGQEKRPVMLHRAIIGSPERFMMILIEHFAGAFPLWLAPVQTVIIPISDNQLVYSKLIHEQLKEAGIRAELWDEADSMQKKIRQAEKQKVPFMLIIGDREVKSQAVSVRSRGEVNLGQTPVSQFIKQATTLIRDKSLTLSM